MAFKAKGLSLARLPSGLLQAGVEYFTDDEPEKVILTHHYIVANRATLNAKVAAQLAALKDGQDEATEDLNIIGQELGRL